MENSPLFASFQHTSTVQVVAFKSLCEWCTVIWRQLLSVLRKIQIL